MVRDRTEQASEVVGREPRCLWREQAQGVAGVLLTEPMEHFQPGALAQLERPQKQCPAIGGADSDRAAALDPLARYLAFSTPTRGIWRIRQDRSTPWSATVS
jgi:hypothetical protein